MKFLRWYAWATVVVCVIISAVLVDVYIHGGSILPVIALWLYGSFSLMVAMAPVVREPEEWNHEDH